LKKIAEKQLEEALNSLQVIFNQHKFVEHNSKKTVQAEREAKYALKKELDQRMNSQSMYNLSNLAFSIRGWCLFKFVTF
jgi:protein bicaudal D